MSWQNVTLVSCFVNRTGKRDNLGHVPTTVNETGIYIGRITLCTFFEICISAFHTFARATKQIIFAHL